MLNIYIYIYISLRAKDEEKCFKEGEDFYASAEPNCHWHANIFSRHAEQTDELLTTKWMRKRKGGWVSAHSP